MIQDTIYVFEYLEQAENPSWDEFHKLYPKVSEWEYELGVKEFQEM